MYEIFMVSSMPNMKYALVSQIIAVKFRRHINRTYYVKNDILQFAFIK